jgi:hypothetical protein
VTGHSQVDGGCPAAGGDLIHLGELVAGGGEADPQARGFAGPAFALGFADAGGQVVADLRQPWPLRGVGPQQRAADACLTCPMFMTTPQFLPQHHQQRHQVIQIISAAEARGQQRLAEMNRQVLGNLDQIIATLETPAAPDGTGAADAR